MKSQRRHMRKPRKVSTEKREKRINTRERRDSKTKRERKSHRSRSRRRHVMRGGVAAFAAPTTSSTNDTGAKSFGATSYINSTPQPALQVMWGIQNVFSRAYNELFGHPKQITNNPSPIVQRLVKASDTYIPKPTTNSGMAAMKASLLSHYNK